MNQKLQKALELSEEILEKIELEEESLESIALKCLRLARLINDTEGMEWLQYEIKGYKKSDNCYVDKEAYNIAKAHGRSYINSKDKKEYIFIELSEEINGIIESNMKRINNMTTQGASVAGNYAAIAMNNLTESVAINGSTIVKVISDNKRKLGILKGEYYKYALNINLELGFSKSAEDIFGIYREKVDNKLATIIGDSSEKLSAIYDRLSEDNKESWSQAADTCRKLFKGVADNLFKKMYPDYTEKTVKVKSGSEVDITGEKYVNRLTVCLDNIDKLSNKHIQDTIAWINKVNDRICNGVHNDITYQEIQQIIIHTYICLGDILINFDISDDI